jgi:MtrB/PioB family decaheme-associated outer membrane protein
MKKLLSFTLVLGLVLGGALRLPAAEDSPKDQVVIKGEAVAAIQGVDDVRKSSKFTEYRDVPNGFVFNAIRFSLTKGDRYLNMFADRIRQQDARYGLSFGQYGKLKADFVWDKIPHRFSFFAKTLYVEPEPGVFTLPDEIQTLVEAAVGNGGGAAAANIGAGRSLISEFLTGAHPIDLGLQRNKGSLDLAYTPSVPLSFSLEASREKRTGTRESSASFGFNFSNELPEPIDYITTNLDARAEYTKGWGTLQAGYDVSLFDNEIESMIWDNPFRITDQTYETPFGAYVNGNGSVKGQMALFPSNSAQKVYFKGLVKILKYTRLSGTFSYGYFSQNEPLLPYTVNTALVADYSGALTAPRETAHAKAGITSFDLALNSRLVKDLYVNAGFRYYNFDNRTEAMDLPGYSRLDQVWESTPISIEPYSYRRSKAFADLSWHVMRNTSISVGYSYSTIERTEGEEVEGTPEDKSHENTFKASIDSNPVDWLTVRASYLHGDRKWSLDGTDVIYDPDFAFRRYYEANRNRDSVNALVGLSLVNNLDLELSYSLGNDRYPTADYGLTRSDFWSAGADLTYIFAKGASVFAFYTHEVYKGDQADRQSNADGSWSVDTANDWTAALNDTVNTIGAGFNTVLVKDRFNLNASYSLSRVKGMALLYSPAGGTPDAAVDFTDGIDTTRIQILRAQLEWKLRSNLSVAFGYWLERYDLDDIVRNLAQVDYIVAASGIFLGALEPGYLYHVGTVKIIYAW